MARTSGQGLPLSCTRRALNSARQDGKLRMVEGGVEGGGTGGKLPYGRGEIQMVSSRMVEGGGTGVHVIMCTGCHRQCRRVYDACFQPTFVQIC